MTRPFGFNIFTTSPALWAHLDRLQPAALLFMDNVGGASEAARRYPDCAVIHRRFIPGSPNESDFHNVPGAILAELQAAANVVPRSVYINLGCEPFLDGDKAANIRRLVAEHVAALEWALSRGVRVAAPHLAHYGLDEQHWPLFDPLIDLMAAHRDLFLFTADEYGAGTLFSGVQDPRYPGDNQLEHISPSRWNVGPDTTFYHVGRITRLLKYRMSVGKPWPRVVITEHGLDRLGDVEPWLNTLQGTGDRGRGWKTIRQQLEAWCLPQGWNAERAYAEMLMAARREIYRPYWKPATREGIEAALIYGWGYVDRQWEPFDVSGALSLQAVLESYQEAGAPVTTPTPVQKPANAGEGVKATLATAYNLRGGNGTNYPIRGNVPAGTLVVYYPATRQVGGSFQWVYCEVNAALFGWMASEGQFLPVLGDPITLNAVPFVDQYGDDAAGPNACGPASGAMAVNYTRQESGQGNPVTAAAFSTAMGRRPGETTTLSQLQLALQNVYGIASDVRAATVGEIHMHVRQGGVVIALLERGEVPGTSAYHPFARAHLWPWIGEGDGFLVAADPLAIDERGRQLKVRNDDATRAMAHSTWQKADGTIVTNSGPQALFVAVPQPATDPGPAVPPDLYAAVMAQIARIDQIQLALGEVKESLAGSIGYQ